MRNGFKICWAHSCIATHNFKLLLYQTSNMFRKRKFFFAKVTEKNLRVLAGSTWSGAWTHPTTVTSNDQVTTTCLCWEDAGSATEPMALSRGKGKLLQRKTKGWDPREEGWMLGRKQMAATATTWCPSESVSPTRLWISWGTAPTRWSDNAEQRLVFTERKALQRVPLNTGILRSLALPWLTCVASGKLPSLSVSQFFHVLKWWNTS